MMHRLLACFATALAMAACDAPAGDTADAAPTPPAQPGAAGLIPGTPEGDLGDWVRGIRKGIREAVPKAGTDAAAAQREVLELYVTLQEYAEMYYGPDGRLRAGVELAAAVDTAETRFHELMKLLMAPAPDRASVAAAAAALDRQQEQVARLWRDGEVRLERPAR